MVPRSLLVFVVAVSFPTAAQAQQCTGQPSCQSCLDASTDCTWSAGACLGASSRCINPEFCYNAVNFPALQSNADICAVADTIAAEAALCQQRTSCGDCVATPLSGGGTCQWFNTPIGVSAGICANQCNPVGQCGVTTCGTVADDGAAAVVQSCSQAATCNDCLSLDNLNCGWASFGECFDNGCNDLADVACFSTELFVGLSPAEICQVEQAAATDRATCSVQSGTDCTTCVGTTLADGTTACQWFDDTQACASACGQLGCGVTECPARVESPFDCGNQNSCLDCLTDDNDSSAVSTCGWVVGSCYESCDVIADVECYSASTIPSSTASQICDLEAAQRADAEACSSVTTCADCLATSLTAPPSGDANSPTTCQWLVDLNLCASACGQLGCGVTDQCPDGSGLQSACSQATSCNDCLETTAADGSSSSCAWTIGQCMDSCRVADAPCYTTSGGYAGQTPEEVCQAEQTDLANAATCRSQSSCSDCISTTLADGTTKCRWFEQGNFCGHECGLLGCGVSDQCPVPEPPSITGGDGTGCSAATSCTDCLETTEADGSSASCAWTIGQCMDSCRLADAPCYTTASDGGFAGQTPEEVCLVEQTDNANAELCLGKSSCSDCIATTLADGTTKCQWFEQRNVCGHACTLLGCGVSDQCPTDLDDVPEEPPTIVTDGDGSGCSQATSCTECLAATSPSVATQQLDDTAASSNNNIKCAWSAGACADSCAADATCYSADAFPNLATGDAICQKEQTDLADAATCNNQSTCTDCVGTKLDDGTTTCQWFGNYCASACGMEGCGVTQCADDATPPASSSSCSDATTCIDCMSSSCAWTVGECMNSCMVADAACYTTGGSFAGQTPQQICQVELDNQANAATCDSQGSCSDCVTTVLTDGTTTCQWFADGNYCGSGCGMQGCGATTCEDDDSSAVAAGGNSDFLARFSWLVLLPMVVGSVFG